MLQNHCYFLSSLFVCCLTGQYNSAKKRLVQLAVISGWHYQNKSYPVVVVDCDSNVISSFFKIVFKFSFGKLFKVIKKRFIKISLTYLLFDLFCDNNNYSIPPPTPRLSILKSKNINCYNLYVVAQFYPWSKFYFLLF